MEDPGLVLYTVYPHWNIEECLGEAGSGEGEYVDESSLEASAKVGDWLSVVPSVWTFVVTSAVIGSSVVTAAVIGGCLVKCAVIGCLWMQINARKPDSAFESYQRNEEKKHS